MRSPYALLLAVVPTVLLAPAPGAAAPPQATGPDATGEAPALEVVVGNLDHPRGLWLGPLGTVVVAESGREGTTPCLPPSPGTGNVPACYSATGSITLAWAGHQVRLVEDLASDGSTDGTAATGPHDVIPTPHGLKILYGYANNPTLRDRLGEGGAPLGTLATITWGQGQEIVGDLAAYEATENPDGRPGFPGQWTNPMSLVPDGPNMLVSDAGANAIFQVTPSGEVSVAALMPLRQVPAPPTGALVDMESSPTGMVRGPDGDLYVGELTGFPFPIGGARVYKVAPGEEPEVVATGFTNIIDVAFDHQGRLLVLEHRTNSLLSDDTAGALKRVEADGSITTLVGSGLTNPTAMAVGHDGSVYMTNNATAVGAGEVVRFQPPA